MSEYGLSIFDTRGVEVYNSNLTYVRLIKKMQAHIKYGQDKIEDPNCYTYYYEFPIGFSIPDNTAVVLGRMSGKYQNMSVDWAAVKNRNMVEVIVSEEDAFKEGGGDTKYDFYLDIFLVATL